MEFDFYDVEKDVLAIAESIQYSLGDIFFHYSENVYSYDEKKIKIDLSIVRSKITLLDLVVINYQTFIDYEQDYAVQSFIECCKTTVSCVRFPTSRYHAEHVAEQKDRFIDVYNNLRKKFH